MLSTFSTMFTSCFCYREDFIPPKDNNTFFGIVLTRMYPVFHSPPSPVTLLGIQGWLEET
jgi:hypothetical protein